MSWSSTPTAILFDRAALARVSSVSFSLGTHAVVLMRGLDPGEAKLADELHHAVLLRPWDYWLEKHAG